MELLLKKPGDDKSTTVSIQRHEAVGTIYIIYEVHLGFIDFVSAV